MQRRSHYYSTPSINVLINELVRSWETPVHFVAVCDGSDGVAVKTVLVLYIVHPLIHRIHFLSKHSDGWGVGVWLCLRSCSLILYFMAMYV